MAREWVVSPESLIYRAVAHGMITLDESRDPKFVDAAESVCEFLRDGWSEGCGFGSSDFTYLLKDFLAYVGIKADFVNGRLTRLA